jgi:hypothetical protein
VERNPQHTDRIDPIDIKIDEAFQFYHLTKGGTKEEALVDHGMEVRY